MREPEGEGLAARVPASPAASRPRPAAACPAAAAEKEEEDDDEEEEEEEKGWAGLPRAALAAVRGARAGRPRRGAARRGLRRAGGAGRRDSARGGGALSRAAPLGPLPLRSSVGACALRAPQPLMSCAARGAAGLGGIRCPPKAYTRAGENCLALPLSGSEPDRLSLPLYVPSPLYLALL